MDTHTLELLEFDKVRALVAAQAACSLGKDAALRMEPGLDLGADRGRVQNATLQPLPGGDAWRVSFQLDPGGEKLVELHARLLDGERSLSETWTYRWTA